MSTYTIDDAHRDLRTYLGYDGLGLERLETPTYNRRFYGAGIQILDRQGFVLWSCSGLPDWELLEKAVEYKASWRRYHGLPPE